MLAGWARPSKPQLNGPIRLSTFALGPAGCNHFATRRVGTVWTAMLGIFAAVIGFLGVIVGAVVTGYVTLRQTQLATRREREAQQMLRRAGAEGPTRCLPAGHAARVAGRPGRDLQVRRTRPGREAHHQTRRSVAGPQHRRSAPTRLHGGLPARQ